MDAAINPSGDIDVFRVNAPSGSRLWVYVDTGGASNPDSETRNSTLRIFRSNLSVVDTDLDDRTGNGLDLTTETGLSSTIGNAVLSGSADDNYYIEVNEFVLNDVIDPYRLFVVITDGSSTAESNTTNIAKATPDILVASGQDVGVRSGAVNSDSDVDWYAIEGGNAGDVIYVNLEGIVGRNHLVDLFLPTNATTTPDFTANSAGITGIPVVESLEPGEAFAFLAQTSGTYLLRVRRQAVFISIIRVDFGAGSYDLMASICRTPPPTITCPNNMTAVAPASCNPATGAVVNYPSPVASGGSGSLSVECIPASGSVFPVGTTTVTCTATDAVMQTAQCSFTVTVFNGCLQDEANPGRVVLFNTFTGEYRFCCNGVVVKEGKGAVDKRACNYTITHNTTDRRVYIKVSFSTKEGAASVQMPVGQIKCAITDKNITNNTCNCPNLAVE